MGEKAAEILAAKVWNYTIVKLRSFTISQLYNFTFASLLRPQFNELDGHLRIHQRPQVLRLVGDRIFLPTQTRHAAELTAITLLDHAGEFLTGFAPPRQRDGNDGRARMFAMQ